MPLYLLSKYTSSGARGTIQSMDGSDGDGSVMAAEAPARPLLRQTAINMDAVRQFPGQLQVDRRVLVDIPGKFFPSLQRLSTGTTKSTMLHAR